MVSWIVIGLSLGLLASVATWIVRDGNENDRRKRETLGYCYACGYDCRHSQSVCPECGHRRRLGTSRRRLWATV